MKLVSDMGGFAQPGMPAIARQGSGDISLYERTDYLTALGSSTYIALDQLPIVSQGTPILIWKNGALLFYGSDYTVLGRIVTITTSLNDKFAVQYWAQRMQGNASSLSPVLASFDPANLGTHATLSNANRTVTSDTTANWGIARTQAPRSIGKRIFELQDVVQGTGSGYQFGLIDAGQSVNSSITASGGTNQFGVQTQAPTLAVRGVTNAAFGSPKGWSNGDYIQVAADISANKIWVSRKRATSTTSAATASSGSVAFTTQASLVYPTGHIVTATSASTGEWMTGTVSSYSGTTLTVAMTACSGSGTHTDWNIDAWIGGGSPDAGSLPTLTYTGSVTWYGALAVNGTGAVNVQGTFNGVGSFILTPQNAASFTPWDN
jgi:hypothetical protein